MNAPRDPELERWRDAWSGLGDAPALAAQLAQRADRDRARLRRAAALEALAVLASTSVVAALVVRGRGALEVTALAVLVALFNGAWLAQFFAARAGVFDASAEGLDGLARLALERLEVERRWVRTARRWTVALTAALLPWMALFAYRQRARYLAEPWRAVVGFGGALAILALVALQLRRRDGKLAREAEALAQQLADASLEG